jgi:hypothetical protein
MIKKVVSSCSQEGRKKRQQSTWGSQTRRSQEIISTRDAKQGPPRSRSQRLRRLLTIATKREEKRNDNQHENYDQESCEQLQAHEMQYSNYQDHDHDDQEGL